MMLKKLFNGGQPNNNRSSVSLSEARASGLEKNEWDERTGYAVSLAQLDKFEARLRDTLRVLTRQCQAITGTLKLGWIEYGVWAYKIFRLNVEEMCASTSAFTDHILPLVVDTAFQPDAGARKRQSDEAMGLVNMFRVSAIAPLQSLLILVPQLRVRCEHRKSAMQLMLRYQVKVHDIERSTKTKKESSRLQRNRAKLQAASARFRDIDTHVQQEIRIIVSNDIASIVARPTREVLLRAQYLTGQFLVSSTSSIQPVNSTPSPLAIHKDLAHEPSNLSTEKYDAHPPPPQRRSAMIVLPPAPEDNNVYVRQSILAPPAQPKLHVMDIGHQRQTSETASDAEEPQLGDDPAAEMSGHDAVAEIHEDFGIGKRKKHVHGTRTWNIHQHIKDNMSTGVELLECVRLPDGFARDEWIAVHVVDFFNEINLLYGTISEFCTAETCPRMSAGPCYAYTWTDTASVQQASATHLPASQYVARLMDWIESQINDPCVFPSNGTHYQPDFEADVACVVLKRLFRVYAHMYHSHLDHFAELSADVHLGFCFKRFVFFVKQFDLVDGKELNALRKLVQSVLEDPADVQLTPELVG